MDHGATGGYIGLGAVSGLRPDGCLEELLQRCALSGILEAVGSKRLDLWSRRLR